MAVLTIASRKGAVGSHLPKRKKKVNDHKHPRIPINRPPCRPTRISLSTKSFGGDASWFASDYAAPGKRVRHTILPAMMLTAQGSLALSFGCMGALSPYQRSAGRVSRVQALESRPSSSTLASSFSSSHCNAAIRSIRIRSVTDGSWPM